MIGRITLGLWFIVFIGYTKFLAFVGFLNPLLTEVYIYMCVMSLDTPPPTAHRLSFAFS